MSMYDSPYWGMHLFWWAFWIIAMVSVFGFNLPERTRVNSLDPKMILKRRLAKGEITDDEYKRINSQLLSDEKLVQQDFAVQSSHLKTVGHPMIDGLSFSATWVVFYSSCALLFLIAPAAMMTATSQLFHGMSFTQMAETGTPYSFGGFVSALSVGAVYMFATGVVWSVTHSYFLRKRSERKLKRTENVTLEKAQLSAQLR